MKKFAGILCLGLIVLSGTVQAGGKKKTINTYITESWQEKDYFGAGTHITLDRIRPNLYLLVHKVDGELTDLVGVPNNAQAGEPTFIDPAPFATYDRLNILSRINYGQTIAARKYGDWSNQDPVWTPASGFLDSSGANLLELLPEINGEKGTRYRFTVQAEDNTPFWFKNEGGPVMYFPYELVIFRITERAGGTTNAEAFEETGAKDELIVIRKDRDLRLDDMVGEHRLRNGRFVFNFTVYHTFRQAIDYDLVVSARDIERNERVMRVPITMGQLRGIQLQNTRVNTIRDDN